MTGVLQYLKSNRIRLIASLMFFSLIMVILTIKIAPPFDSKFNITCTKEYEDGLRCDFNCIFDTDILPVRMVINHRLWCSIYDKTVYNNSVDFSLPKRNYTYIMYAVANKENYFIISNGIFAC